MDVPEFGQVGLISETEIEGTPLQMMIDGDRMVIASMIYAWNLPVDHPLRELLIEEVQWGEGKDVYTYYRVQNLVKYTVVDITDRAAPEVERELSLFSRRDELLPFEKGVSDGAPDAHHRGQSPRDAQN